VTHSGGRLSKTDSREMMISDTSNLSRPSKLFYDAQSNQIATESHGLHYPPNTLEQMVCRTYLGLGRW
jgi:hypothetical protein